MYRVLTLHLGQFVAYRRDTTGEEGRSFSTCQSMDAWDDLASGLSSNSRMSMPRALVFRKVGKGRPRRPFARVSRGTGSVRTLQQLGRR